MNEKFIKRFQADKVVFFICLGISVALGIIGFFMPPEGQIDSSVLKYTAELFAFAALGVGAQAIKDGRSAVIKHGETEININHDDDGTQGDSNAN